jgi:hypothetical protein
VQPPSPPSSGGPQPQGRGPQQSTPPPPGWPSNPPVNRSGNVQQPPSGGPPLPPSGYPSGQPFPAGPAFPPGQGYQAGPGVSYGHGYQAGPGGAPGPADQTGQFQSGQEYPPHAGRPMNDANQGLPAQSTSPLPAVAGVGGIILVLLGLSVPFDSTNGWSAHTAWAIFAALAAIVAVTPLVTSSGDRPPRTVFNIGAAGAAGLFAYWLLLVLPSVGSNEGFVLTVGTALAVAAVWWSPTRPR